MLEKNVAFLLVTVKAEKISLVLSAITEQKKCLTLQLAV